MTSSSYIHFDHSEKVEMSVMRHDLGSTPIRSVSLSADGSDVNLFMRDEQVRQLRDFLNAVIDPPTAPESDKPAPASEVDPSAEASRDEGVESSLDYE